MKNNDIVVDIGKQLQELNDAPLEGCQLPNIFELTTDVHDKGLDNIEERMQMLDSIQVFGGILKSIGYSNPDERYSLITKFYDELPDTYWNEFILKVFNYKPEANFGKNNEMNHTIIEFAINKDSTTPLADIKYKTSVIEKSRGWEINEDPTFGNEKPEVLDFLKYNLYSVKAKILEDYLRIPYAGILSDLKRLDTALPGVMEYFFYKALGPIEYSLIKNQQKAMGLLEDNPSILVGTMRLRDHAKYHNNIFWNAIIKQRIIIKDIGYFTVGKYSKFIGNIWVDEKFRGKGILGSMFNYIRKNILPFEDFLFISTKNPVMIKKIEEFKEYGDEAYSYKYNNYKIGRTLPYESKSTLKSQNEVTNPLEHLYVLAHKGNENFLHFYKDAINSFNSFVRDTYFDEEMYPSILCLYPNTKPEDEIQLPTFEALWSAYKHNKEYPNFKILGITKDPLVCKQYWNYYTESFDRPAHLVFEFEGETWFYPCFDNDKPLFKLKDSDVRALSYQLPKNRIEIHRTKNHRTNIGYSIVTMENVDGTKIIKLDETGYDKPEQLKQFFDKLINGIELSGLSLRGFRPYEFNIDEQVVRFISTDMSCTTHKTIEELL